jgi:type I restriction enzyme, R subunit
VLQHWFSELYNLQHMTSNTLDDVSRVSIITIQRLYSMLKGEELPAPTLQHGSFTFLLRQWR